MTVRAYPVVAIPPADGPIDGPVDRRRVGRRIDRRRVDRAIHRRRIDGHARSGHKDRGAVDRSAVDGGRDKVRTAKGMGGGIGGGRKSTGARFAIGLHGPLTPDEPTDADLKDIKEYATSLTVLLEDELVVRRNLPFATQKLIEKLG